MTPDLNQHHTQITLVSGSYPPVTYIRVPHPRTAGGTPFCQSGGLAWRDGPGLDHRVLLGAGPGCWSIRPRGESTAPVALGSGDFTADFAWSRPDPEPVTTIAWRIAHVVMGCFGMRNAAHFGGPPVDPEKFEYAGTAAEALRQLDDGYATWVSGVRSLGPDGLAQPCGPAEGPYADSPMAGLVLHIHREVIHHGAEIALLRDLYRRQG
jgi:DinB superfamily